VEEASNLILFEGDKELIELLDKLGMNVEESKVFTSDGNPAKCDCCEEQITVENFGTLMPGSEYFYCSNPACIMKYYAKTL